MTKRLILIALAILVGISSYAYAEVQNIKVSGDIAVQGISREAFTLRDAKYTPTFGALWVDPNVAGVPLQYETADATDDYILSTVRVRLDADLTDNVAAVVRLLNERIWGQEDTNADNSEVNVDLAYITLKEFLYSPLTLNVGRQNLRFGNALIVGDPDTNVTYLGANPAATIDIAARDLSARKAFDAIRATLDYSPLVVDLVFAKIDENDIAQNDDVDLYGVNACYDFGVMNTIGELYYFEKKNDSEKSLVNKEDIVRTVGIRAQSEPIENLTLNAEVAHQFGKFSGDQVLHLNDVRTLGAAVGYGGRDQNLCVDRNAWAVQVGADYLFADLQYTPGVSVWYTYLSGDEDEVPGTATGDYTGWDPMFEDQGGGTIYNAIMAASNCHMINLNGSLKPMDDLTAVLGWTHIRLAKDYRDQRRVILTGILGYPYNTMTEESHIGDEIDLVLTYDYTEDVQFGLNAGMFVPGSAFSDLDLAANNRNASQVIGSMKVTF